MECDVHCPCVAELGYAIPVAALVKIIHNYAVEYSGFYIKTTLHYTPHRAGQNLWYDDDTRELIYSDLTHEIIRIDCDPNDIISRLTALSFYLVNDYDALDYIVNIALAFNRQRAQDVKKCNYCQN